MRNNQDSYFIFRCVDIQNSEWWHLKILFDDNNITHSIRRCTLMSREFLVRRRRLALYHWNGKEFSLFRIQMQQDKETGGLKYYLVNSKKSLSYAEFNQRYCRSLIWKKTHIKHTKKKFSNGTVVRVFSRKILRSHHPNFISIATDNIKRNGLKHKSSLKTSLFPMQMNSSQNELNTFFSESKKPSGGILKSPERKSCQLDEKPPSPRKVQFMFSNYPANQSANAKSSQSKQTPDVMSSFWLKAYKTPLGKWGFVFLLLGLLGMIATTQGSILFYGAIATSIIGSTLLGINFFRVSRPPIQQVVIPISYVPKIP